MASLPPLYRAALRCVAPFTLLLAACDGRAGSGPENEAVPTAMTLSIADVTLNPGDSVRLEATPRNHAGVPVATPAVAWSTSDPSVAAVSATTGLVTAIDVGTAVVTATSEGVSAQARIAVAPVAANLVAVAPAWTTISAGQTLQLTAKVGAVAGAASGALTWRSSDPSVATVSAKGEVLAVAPGTATITLQPSGGASAASRVVVARAATARGQLLTLDDAPLGTLRVTARSRGVTSSAPVAPSGAFSIPLESWGDTLDIVIDAADGAVRINHPALLRFIRASQETLDRELRILMVPRRWAIDSGTYAQTPVNVSMNEAFTPPCSDAGNANCDGFYPGAWSGGVVLWPESAFPVAVALDRTRSNDQISAGDSSAFWQVLQQMNKTFGRTLFRPATEREVSLSAQGIPSQAIVVRIDNTLKDFAAVTNTYWNGARDVTGATIRVQKQAYLANTTVVFHEFLHAVGFKHSCSWSTVMGGYGCGETSALSSQDVGYARLATRLRAAQRALGADYGLAEALQGERVEMLRLPPASVSSAAMFDRVSTIGDALYEDVASARVPRRDARVIK